MIYAKLTAAAIMLTAAFTPLHAELGIPCCSKSNIVIDGKADDEVWRNLPWQSGFTRLAAKEPATEQTRFKIFHDNSRIYFLIEALESVMDKRVMKQYSAGSTMIWLNDSLEISLMPDLKALQFRKIMVDCTGIFCDMAGTDDNTNTETYLLNQDWVSHAEIRTSDGEDRWTVEAAVPFGSLGLNSTYSGHWKINIGRNRYAGKTELSSWSPIPVKKHVVPKLFRNVYLKDFKLSRFLFELEKIETRFDRLKDGSFQLTANMTVHNNSGSFARFKTNIALNNLENGQHVKAQEPDFLYAGQYKRITRRIKCSSQGKSVCLIRLESCNTIPVLLCCTNLSLELQYQPLKLTVIRPFYRNNIYATMPDKTIEVKLESEELQGAELNLELSGPGVHEQKVLTAGKTFTFQFDAGKWADGTYELTVSGMKDGREYTAKQKFRKLPYQKGEVWIDAGHVTHVDGKVFFPFGWYGSSGKPRPWNNSTLQLTRFSSAQRAMEVIDRNFRKNGTRMMIFPFQEQDPRGWVPWKVFKDPDTRKKGLTPEQRKMIVDFVGKVGKCEGLLAWYMADEPECRDNNPLWYEEARELIAELDPYHPCIMLNWGMDGIRKYYKGADILMPDCYPQYFEDGTTGHPRWCSSDWAALASSLRPSWQMPLYDCWPALARNGKTRAIPNDLHDQRSQFFQALIHNCKGFNLYAWHYGQRYSNFIFGADFMGETLMKLRDYLLSNTVPDGVAAEIKPHAVNFQAGVKQKTSKDFCLLAVNTAVQDLQCSFTLKNSFTGTLYAAGENRSLQVRNGRFTDAFRGRESHVYLTDRELAGSVPGVRETIETIEKFRAGRKKEGNLIGVGELDMARIIDYGKGILPPGAARLKASSEHRSHINLKTGTLYYLADGLIKPNFDEYSWNPLQADSNPWLEIRLEKQHSLKELVLYTPNGNLIDCDAVVNGKSFSIRGNLQDKIVIPLNGEKADFLRLNILKRKTEGKLLTEAELY